MDYTNFLLKDFLMDEYFQHWVLEPDEESDAFWTAWLRNHPHQQTVIREAREIVMQLTCDEDAPAPQVYQSMWNAIEKAREEIDMENLHEDPKILKLHKNHSLRNGKRFTPPVILMAAATVAFFIAVGILMYVQTRQNSVTYRTGNAETRIVVLPDHSTVILNANTALRLSSDWGPGKSREVWLTGEAYFSVEHLKNYQKFIVHTSTIQVEVLGTKFNVNDHQNNTRIVLHSGKIKLTGIKAENNFSEMIMEPGEMMDVDENRRIIRNQKVDAEVYTAWKNNYLIFERTPLRKIVQRLEDNYGLKVKINISDTSILEREFTARYPAEDLSVLLKALSRSFGISVIQEGDQIIFKDGKD